MSPPPSLSASLFLSYASEDRGSVERLSAALITAGAEVFFDDESIIGGDDWKQTLAEGLLRSEALIAVFTPARLGRDSLWIDWEQAEARRLLRPIIPIHLEACERPESLKDLHWVDLSTDFDAGLVKLINAIRLKTLRRGGDRRFDNGQPPQPRQFVGRDEEIREIFELLGQDEDHVVTERDTVVIQGMGGTGKTMLAEELMRRLEVRHPGGTTWERRGQLPPAANEVIQEWAKTIHDDYPNPEWKAIEVRSALEAEYGTVIVLIDDVSDSDVGSVAELLSALPGDTTRLITTRSAGIVNPAGISGKLYRLRDLSREDGLLLLRRRLEGRGPEPADSILSRLYETVGGHALSLELAAGRCAHTADLADDVEELAEALSEGHIDELAVEAFGEGDRDKASVAANLLVSIRSLHKVEAELTRRFRAFGVFPEQARMDLDLLVAVWGDEADPKAAKKAHRVLYGRALLNRNQAGEFESHPVLRAYALGLLNPERESPGGTADPDAPRRAFEAHDPDEFEKVFHRYIEHITARVAEGFLAPEERWSEMEIYRAHFFHIAGHLYQWFRENVGPIAPLSQSEPQADVPDPDALSPLDRRTLGPALRLATAVRPFAVRRPETGARGHKCLQVGLACARALGHTTEEIEFLGALGRWFEKRDPERAGRYLNAALARAKAAGAKRAEAALMSYKGELLRSQDDADEAFALLEPALEAHRAAGDAAMTARTLRSLGETHWRIGNHDRAWDLYQEALTIHCDAGNRSGEGDMYNKLGSVQFNRGEKREAIKYFEKALAIHEEVQDRSMQGEDLNDMGVSHTYLDEPDEAIENLEKAAALHKELNSRRLRSISLCNLAHTYLRKGDFRQAHDIADEALQIAGGLEALVPWSWALCWKGRALQEMGRLDEAQPLLELAEDKARLAKNWRGVAGHLGNLGVLLRDMGDVEQAAKKLRGAIQIFEDHRDLTEAFGGRRREDLEALLAEVEVQER